VGSTPSSSAVIPRFAARDNQGPRFFAARGQQWRRRRKSRQVIALSGDGGFNMLMSEFLTAAHHKAARQDHRLR
jgi:hypothetical protein